MIDRLERLVEDVSTAHSKLVLLIGEPGTGKSRLLGSLAERRTTSVLNAGAALGRELLTIPRSRRHLHAAEIFRNLAHGIGSDELLLVDNIEILFDRTLKLNPLDLLKRQAQSYRTVAAWPGKLRQNRLTYAETGHPEHQDYAIDGLVPFVIN
ncbi:BREX-3 system P-loop-containing protein BrxF [Ruegeria arenilitoris]|uniref:BREX-3 system P-loop-containing protein BrxF n=1 Tax=Ruegeria arenilitoris TaxID=1173585 RepID=UPI001C968DAA|nr:BREX-3 system P-loop-containing protein BrxF [Ruegeria arenilitoris]MBY6083623.1 BREX-3 system P-loop-containing protein BrxF [Ruegeria arenilitoris]